MTLEDFFSLTEMKDGLTAPSRVEELVSVMQKEKDCVVKNVGDAARQWASVASTIAATENRDCLDRFIQLDGLGFINRWLKDAQKFANDSNDNIVEESITAMLRALEKLHIDNDQSLSSGIQITAESLLDHSSAQIQDRARALFDSWKQDRVTDAVDHGVENARPSHNDGIAVSPMRAGESSRSTCSASDVPLLKASTDEENNRAEPAEAENLPSRSEDLQPQGAEGVQIESCNNEQPSKMDLDHADVGDKPSDCPTFSVVENSIMKEKSPVCTGEGISSIETCSSPFPKQSNNEGQSDSPKINEFSKDEKQVHKVSSFPDKICVAASASVSGTVEHRTVPSGVDVPNANETMMETALESNLDTNEGDVHKKAIAFADVRKSASEPNSGIDDMAVGVNCGTLAFKTNCGEDECHSDDMQDSSGDEYLYRKHKDSETSLSRIKDTGAADEDKDHTSDESSDSGNDYDFSKPAVDTRSPNVNKNGTTDIGLEFGIADALEVARKVAQEVEREVVDYREPSCSSSEKNSVGRTKQPNSPDSINGKQDLLVEVLPKEVINGQNSAEAYPEIEGHLSNSDNLKMGQENGIADMESSQVTEAAQEPEVNPERGLCNFDLNQEVCSDDMDRPVNPVSTTVSVVSASRAAAATGLPSSPLQFEGTLGWKGSAATSAFRPASPRRVSDSDKTALTVGGSRQRQDFLDFDLNVAECADDKTADLMPEKQIPVSSSLHSTESSVEVSPRRSERLKLDLNRISDDSDAPPSDLRMEGRLHYNRNGHRSPSPASSSSSMQPSLRNIDLNDRPYLQNDFLEQGPYLSKSSQNVSVFGVPKPDDPVISIMGARVEVNRKDLFSQISSVPNGKALESAMDGNTARGGGSLLGLGPTVSYTHSPVFGYNGLTTTPGLPYSSAMYGPGGSIPYMVDLRGAPVVPQIVGSAAAVQPPYSQPQFMMSMTGAPSGISVAGPSRPNFDLNSGFPIEGGNRDTLSLRQLLMPGQVRSMEEHMRANSQPSSSSGVGGKRKEPDSGWDLYPFMNRHQQPPWK